MDQGRPWPGHDLNHDLDPPIVADQHPLGEIEVGEVVIGDLVENSKRLGCGVGNEIRERFTNRQQRWLVEHDTPAAEPRRQRA